MTAATRKIPPRVAIPAGGDSPRTVIPAGGVRGAGTYDPVDIDYFRDLSRDLFDPLLAAYFRPRLIGAERLPARGPAILAANHSGTAFPWDAMIFDYLMMRRNGMRKDNLVRPVFEKELAQTWWMRPFGIDNFWRRGGGVDMTFYNFDRLLKAGETVLYFPEGVPGIAKGFQRRYQLQRFSSSFVHLAIKHRAPVYPIYVINAEWVIPFNFTWKPLDRLVRRLAGVPFLPLPAGPLAVLLPWLWYLALPARMIFSVGAGIDVCRIARECGLDTDRLDRDQARRVAQEIRRRMQPLLEQRVDKYGRAPYHWRSLKQTLRSRGGRAFMPWTWPWAFVRHHRDRARPPAGSWLHRWLRDWDLLGFYLPLGWPLLSLARRFRKPPCGYRGLSEEERREREGAFVWHLSERPLPPPDVG